MTRVVEVTLVLVRLALSTLCRNVPWKRHDLGQAGFVAVMMCVYQGMLSHTCEHSSTDKTKHVVGSRTRPLPRKPLSLSKDLDEWIEYRLKMCKENLSSSGKKGVGNRSDFFWIGRGPLESGQVGSQPVTNLREEPHDK